MNGIVIPPYVYDYFSKETSLVPRAHAATGSFVVWNP